MKSYQYISEGFTLVEILLVIGLIAMLTTGLLLTLNPNQRLAQARNGNREAHINQLHTALVQYRLQQGGYPAGINTTYQEICDPQAISCTGYIDLSGLSPNYIPSLPEDPLDNDSVNGNGYQIRINLDGDSLSLRAVNPELGSTIEINP